MLLSAVDPSLSYQSNNQDYQEISDFNHDQTQAEDPSQDDHTQSPDQSLPSNGEATSHERWTRTPQPRGRRARDPDAQYIRFDCKDVDDLEIQLAEYLSAPTAPAEHATIEFHFPITSAFMVYTRDFKRDPNVIWTPAEPSDLMRRTAVSVADVLAETPTNPKERMIRQKAVARITIEAVQRADGFRYSFHNNWLSREDQAHRFSYFCNDSVLNKGRAASGGALMVGKPAKKPVYECQGFIAIKFSATKRNLEVHYKHIPLHKTFEERAPALRNGSKRKAMLEILEPERLKEAEKRREEKRKRKTEMDKEKEERRKRQKLVASQRKKKTSTSDKTARNRPSASRSHAMRQDDSRNSQSEDEALRPLIDFLGSAERQTPLHGHDDDSQGGDGGIVIPSDDDDAPAEVDNEVTLTSRPAFPAEKLRELNNPPPTLPKHRKLDGPLYPGMMAGSLRGGDISWGDQSLGEADQQIPESERQRRETEKQKKQKATKRPEPLAGLSAAATSQLSELQVLKEQLAATQERLRKLEQEKSQPPMWPPYPPPYGYPPYPPYPPPYGYPPYPPYPPPPNPHHPQNPPPPLQNQNAGPWKVHQPTASSKKPRSAAAMPAGPTTSGGSPQPNAASTESISVSATPAQSVTTTHEARVETIQAETRASQRSGSPSRTQDNSSSNNNTSTPKQTSGQNVAQSARPALETVPNTARLDAQRLLELPEVRPLIFDPTTSMPPPQRPHAAPSIATRPPTQQHGAPSSTNASSGSTTSSADLSNQVLMGILKPSNPPNLPRPPKKPNYGAYCGSHYENHPHGRDPLFSIYSNINENFTDDRPAPPQKLDDPYMKSLFNSAIQAMAAPNPAATSSPSAPSAKNSSASNGSSTFRAKQLPPSTQPPQTSPQGHSPHPYPYHPLQYPYSAYGPPSSSASSPSPQAPTSATRPTMIPPPPPPPPPSTDRPPASYDALRTEMEAYARSTNTPTERGTDDVHRPTQTIATENAQADRKKARPLHVNTNSPQGTASDDQPQAPMSAVSVSTTSSTSTSMSAETAREQADRIAEDSSDFDASSEEV